MKKATKKKIDKLMDELVATPGKKISLKDYDADWTGTVKSKEEAEALLAHGVQRLSEEQEKLYAQDTYSLLMVFQAMDAAGKDGTIRHVMSGINPQGCQVFSFKAPSAEERDHDYLWRTVKALPERGRIGIHNRSYYEEVLVARVHPEILAGQQLPEDCKGDGVWKRRFEQINNFERHLHDNGTRVLKFYLNVSRKEQKERFLARIDEAEKNWKFSVQDAKERTFWKDYMHAYEQVFTHTSTKYAPWYIIPADNKWFMRLAVAAIAYRTLKALDLKFPTVSKQKKLDLVEARKVLMAEKD
jgi:PPK2 family polyphosphate:nucleotide phosphotransferase